MPLHAHVRIEMIQGAVRLRAAGVAARVQALDLVVPPARAFAHRVAGEGHERVRARGRGRARARRVRRVWIIRVGEIRV